MTWHDRMVRWGPWCGIVVPGLDALINGVVAAVQPNYDALGEYISDLSAPDVPYSGLIRGWWIAFPILFGPFVLSLHFRLKEEKASVAVPILLMGFAFGLAGCGIFHCDPGCRGLTFSAHVHFICSYVAAATLYLSPVALGIVGWRNEHWHDYEAINVICLVLGGGIGLALFLAKRNIVPDRGLFERLYFGVFYGWVILVAIRLLQLERLPLDIR